MVMSRVTTRPYIYYVYIFGNVTSDTTRWVSV
nr:MAG TPA: hypothetical protein [Bacteriophage sp.]